MRVKSAPNYRKTTTKLPKVDERRSVFFTIAQLFFVKVESSYDADEVQGDCGGM